MNDEQHSTERQSLQTRLLDAVKQCQVRFGGRTELATDTDARVSCLCSAWETVLQHGLKGNAKAITALKQVTEITGLNKMTGMFAEKATEKETAFWNYTREILTKHEAERFIAMKNINTDSGRGRAWLRAAINEHSLERYMHMLIESEGLLCQYYEPWSFLRDQERSSMLPMMARGLDSILFAITVDNPALNAVRQAPGTVVNVGNMQGGPSRPDDELRPVIAGESPVAERKKEKKKKKKVTHIVSFDDDETGSGRYTRVGQPEKSGSFSYGSPSSQSSASSETHSAFSRESVVTSELKNRVNGSLTQSGEFGQSDHRKSGELSQLDFRRSSEISQSDHRRSGDFGQSDHRTQTLGSSSSQSGGSLQRSMSRDPSIASGRSDERPSQGSFSSADFELSMEISSVMTPITPAGESALDDDDSFNDDAMLSRSCESTGLSAYNGDDIKSAAFALQQAQISFDESHRTQGDGGNVSEDIKSDRMSTEELKKAVVSMMLRKDEVEEQNRSLKQLLDQEMEVSSVLRAEIEQMKHTAVVKNEKEQLKLQAMHKENELLKHQLRKYVNAVQMLRTEGTNVDENLGIHMDEPQPNIPPEKPKTDYSHEAEEYEKKLIQVAEMHGELMEFNELLHRQLNMREAMLKRLQGELVDLRGPLPQDINFTDDPMTLGIESLTLQSTRLINVWIPSAFLKGSASDSHHVYQVYVRIKDEEWNVYKRYKQFDELHSHMKKQYPLTGKFEFPHKKAFGKKDSKVVETRRTILQGYLRSLINHLLEKDQTIQVSACKQKLIEVLPFFSDKVSEKDKKKQKKKKGKNGDGQRTPLSTSPRDPAPLAEQYGGL